MIVYVLLVTLVFLVVLWAVNAHIPMPTQAIRAVANLLIIVIYVLAVISLLGGVRILQQ